MMEKRKNKAVSDVVAVALLLGISIALFAVVQMIALSFPFNPHPPTARLVGNIEGNFVNVSHNGGEPLLLNETKIIYNIGENSYDYIIYDRIDTLSSNKDNYWNVGEKLYYKHSAELKNFQVNIFVIDLKTNSIIMNSRIQE